MIHSVKLLRWKSHEKTEIAFSKGTNVLVGPMGAGKTSVVDALSFALYGTFPSLKSKKVTLEEIVMQRPEKFTEGKVEVLLETGGKKYILERTISAGGAKAFLMEGGKLIETGPTRVTEAVERLLKTDYELFARTIYADQNNIDSFLSLSSGDRKRQIDELLGLDKFEKARTGAGAASSKLKAMKAEAERATAGLDGPKLKAELEQVKGEETQIYQKLQEAQKQSKELETQAGFKKEKAQKLSQKQAEHTVLESEQTGQKAALQSLEENISRISGQAKKKIPAGELEAVAKGISAELAAQLELRNSISELLPKKEKLSAQIEAANGRITSLAKETGGKQVQEFESELAAQRNKASQVKEIEKQLSEKHSQCGTGLAMCLRAEKEKDELGKRILEMQGKLAQETQLMEQAGNADENHAKLSTYQETERTCGASVMELRQAIEKLGALHSQCVVCDSPLTHEKSTELLARKKGEMQDAEAGLAKAAAERKTLEMEIEKARALKAEAEKIAEKLVDCKKELEKVAAHVEKLPELKADAEKLSLELSLAKQELLEIVKRDSLLAAAIAAAKEFGEIVKQMGSWKGEEKTVAEKLSSAQEKYSEEKRALLEDEMKTVEKNRELLLLQAQAQKAMQRLSQAQEKLSALNFEPKELENTRVELLETEKNLAVIRVLCESGEKMLAEKKVRKQELQVRAEAAEKQAARLAKLDSSIASVAKFQNAVSQAQGHLRSELVEAVNEAAGILWKSIYPYADYQSVKLNAGEQDYSVELLANTGDWIPAEHASGGEKTCASLSLRIAFAAVLTPHLSLLVLDEPTHNLDANAIASFCRTLREDLPKIVEQTFIITHDEALKEGANATVYKVERDKDRGDKSTVEKLSMS